MIKIAVRGCSLNPCVTYDELRSLGSTLTIFHNYGQENERYDFETYVPDSCYLQVLDLLIHECKHVIVKESQEDLTDEELHYLTMMRMWTTKKTKNESSRRSKQ